MRRCASDSIFPPQTTAQSPTIIATIETTNTKNYNGSPNKTSIEVNPDEIFSRGSYDKLILLEKLLLEDKYIDCEKKWIAKHKNNQPDIKRLQIFVKGLMQNNYFLPKKNTQIRDFFELRYNIKIGQVFEQARLNKLKDEYKATFFNYNFESATKRQL